MIFLRRKEILAGAVLRLPALLFGLTVLASSATAQRGMLDDVPLTGPQRIVPGQETPIAPRKQEMPIARNLAELKGCWESVNGELPIFRDNSFAERIGSYRACYCFGADGRGTARNTYTTDRQVVVAAGQKVCESPLTATIGASTLTMQYTDNMPCTDGSTIGGLGPIVWICSATPSNASICAQQPPYSNRRETFVRVSEKQCGWRG